MKRKRIFKFSEVVPMLYPATGILIITYDLFTKRENVVIECYGLAFFLIILRIEYVVFKETQLKKKNNNNKNSS
ncbi:hypothetical protein [Bacillus thuringiensis]|uniref:hypothetical protein n=1 Tax=Bacillus thuringiensis TaxID=1428 RepID=UPI0011A9C5F9|nr:hypothetical protein [Bacillus thuringiensis]